jgi:hypothetical protein
MARRLLTSSAALVLLFMLACCARQPASSPGEVGGARSGAAVITLKSLLRSPTALVGIRCAVDREIRYLNNSPGSHPPPRELARVEPGRHQLFVEVRVRESGAAEPRRLRRVHVMTVAGQGETEVVIRLRGSPARLTLQGSAIGEQAAFTPRACSELNGDLSACEGKNPAGHAHCVVRLIRRRAKKRMSPGWMGCADHQANRLRVARQLHGKNQEELFRRSRQLTELALRCVAEYYLCDL